MLNGCGAGVDVEPAADLWGGGGSGDGSEGGSWGPIERRGTKKMAGYVMGMEEQEQKVAKKGYHHCCSGMQACGNWFLYVFNNRVLYEFEKVYFAPNMRDFELVVCKAKLFR